LNVGDRKVFVAGSTRTGEDEIILDVFKKIKNYVLIIVPRHLDRLSKIENLIKENNLTYVKYSELENKVSTGKEDIILVDKMGVLRKLYSISDIAFVGGTLVNIGGHNLLEFIASLTPKEKSSYDEFVKNILKITVDVPSESGMKSIRIKGQNGDFSIADVGFGYSQILPVITKLWHTSYIINLYNSNSYYSRLRFRELDKSIILMEQPELHLHPAMQAKIADAFIKTVDITRKSETPSTLIIETHSQAIINRIGRRIREGKICPEDINVLLFQKDEKLQNTMIKQITFSNEGQLKNWPYGFFDPED